MSETKASLNKSPETGLMFVTGPPRSGTTVLSRQLCEHHQVAPYLPECTFLTETINQYSVISKYSDNKRFDAYFGSNEGCRTCFTECVNAHLKALYASRSLNNYQILVLKDPQLSHHISEAKDLLPYQSKFIIIVRDPRAVIASLKNVYSNKGAQWDIAKVSSDMFEFYMHIYEAKERKDERDYFMKYEDFVMGDFSGLSDFVGYNVPTTTRGSMDMDLDLEDPFYSDLYDKPLTNNKVNSWRNLLTTKEAEHINYIFSGVLQYWGYNADQPVTSKYLKLKHYIIKKLQSFMGIC